MESPTNDQPTVALPAHVVIFLTTEHYNLQTGRSMTIAEANGRSSLFVGAVSSGLIALTFAGQISHLGLAFFVFSLVVLPTLVFMGLLTFERVLQAGSADVVDARGINRIRHFYLESPPQLQPYFILSAHDERAEFLSQETMQISWWQVFLSTAGLIAVLTSVLVGSFVGLLLAVFTLPLWICTSAGVVAFLLSVGLHQRYQWQWMRLEHRLPVRFPRQPQP